MRATAHGELPQDLLETGVRNIGGISAGAAILLGLYLIALMTVVPRHQAPWAEMFRAAIGLYGSCFALSLVLHGLARWSKIRPQLIVDIGYTYMVTVCLLLSLARHAAPWSASELLRQISPATLPILTFAMLIPAPPRKVLWMSTLAAATDPLAFYLMRDRSLPLALPAGQLLWLLSSPFLVAGVGYGISRIVYRLNEGIVKAREVGSYQLVERLGVGGMAEVWRAEHRMLARPAAVKLIRPTVLQGHGPVEAERLLRIFTREARATARLSSPHTIQLYDFGVTREGAFYTVMELLEGVDLQTLVERFGPQPSERVAYLLAQACHSLAEAHAQAFVHRDVKPANMFTCRLGGEQDVIKVLDFGLVLDRHPTAEELEDEQHFVGTPSVMAPEMVRFQAPVDARADLYALGCVAYWLLTGKRVFEAQTRHDMLIMHAHQKPALPSKRGGVPVHPELEALIMRCLEKNPNKRPQTALEIRETLQAIQFQTPWTQDRARAWWATHLPKTLDETPLREPDSAVDHAPPSRPAEPAASSGSKGDPSTDETAKQTPDRRHESPF
jgi:serine/threonine-protein kinase